MTFQPNNYWSPSFLLEPIDNRPEHIKKFHLAATKYLDKRFSPAASMFESFLNSSNEWPVFFNTGICHMSMNNFNQALKYILSAKSLGLSPEYYDALCDVYILLNDRDSARSVLKTADLPHSKIAMYDSIMDSRFDSLECLHNSKLEYMYEKRPKLQIAFFIFALNLVGGTRVPLDHAHRLAELGHDVTIFSFWDRPEWYDIKVPFFQVDNSLEVLRHFPRFEFMVSNFFCLNFHILPFGKRTYHFAQGDEFTFEFDTYHWAAIKDVVYQAHNIPNKQIVVSNFLGETIRKNFERETYSVIPNTVEEFFYPSKQKNERQIIMLGSESNKFKNVPMMMQALDIVRKKGYDIKVIWVSSSDRINTEFRCDFYKAPAREKLAHLYRTSEVFISASDYESFSLPVLEAMKSGLAVVTSDNGGIRDYVVHGENALVVKPHTAEELSDAVIRLLSDQSLRECISQNAVKTGEQFSWSNISQRMERELYDGFVQNFPVVSW